MRARALVVSLLYAASTVLVVSLEAPAASAATRTLTATPNTGLTSGDVITVAGQGFTPSSTVAVCEGVIAGTPGPEDCGGTGTLLFPIGADGSFSTPLTAARFLTVGGLPVDCAAPGAACGIGAAELNDVPNTAVIVPLTFAPASGNPRPDLIFKRRDTQQLLENDVYFPNVSAAPQHAHPLAANGWWTYALVVQNDGDGPDDLVLSTPILPPAPFTVKVNFSYFDVTSAVTGTGLVFHAVAPGQSFTVGVTISGVGAHDVGVLTAVKLHSRAAPERADFSRLWVDAPSSG